MEKLKFNVLLTFLLTLVNNTVFAQGGQSVEMADVMHENGKIYVVVGVVLILLIGMFLYLIRLDNKVSRMYKELNK